MPKTTKQARSQARQCFIWPTFITSLKNFKQALKRYFHIKEGDFYKYCREDLKNLLESQLGPMFMDNFIDNKESILKVTLQNLFDLPYDQFLRFEKPFVEDALSRGASILDLDTVYLGKLPVDNE